MLLRCFMAISKSAQDRQTNIKLETAYEKVKEIVGKLSKTSFAEIFGKKKQNIGRRMSYGGMLLSDEAEQLLIYLKKQNKTDNDIYKQISSEIMSAYNENNTDNEFNSEDFAELNVRGEVGLSCGYGSVVYNDSITGKCLVPKKALRTYGASFTKTEIVYAQGDSMSPEIKSGDALLVDTSQTNIIDGVVYAFNYDGQPMCKRLQKIGQEITALSANPLFKPFVIDYTCQFNIVGRVVGLMRPVL